MNSIFQVREISSLEQLKQFREEWQDLYQRDPHQNPYNSFEWAVTCFETLQRGRPFILVAEREGKIGAIAPFEMVDAAIFGFNYRSVFFVGTGATGTDTHNLFSKIFSYDNRLSWTDSSDVFYDPEMEGGVSAILSYLRESDEWDMLDFREMPRQSKFQNYFDEEIRTGDFLVESKVVTSSGFIEVPENFEDYKKGLSKKIRKNINLSSNRMRDHYGEVDFQLYSRIEEVEAMLPRIVELENKSWKGQQGVGAFSKQQNKLFHEEFARRCAEAGNFRLFTLEWDDVILSYSYSFESNNILYFHNMAINPDHQKCSPGMAIFLKLIEYATDHKITTLSIGRGSDYFITAMLTGREERLWSKVYKKKMKLRLLHDAEFIWHPRLKQLKEQFQKMSKNNEGK